MSDPFARFTRVRDALSRSLDPLEHPLGAHFRPLDGATWRSRWRALAERIATKQAHSALVLYVHIPFCARVCSYCLLAAQKIPGKDVVDAYVDALVRELEAMGRAVAGVPVSAMHVGGGTPTILSEKQLDAVLGAAQRSFARAPEFVAGIEAHPGSTTRGKLDVIAAHGVSRVSFGVESFTPAVLAAVGRRDQTADRVARAVAHAREAGIAKVNVDLLAGLPGETNASFDETVRAALELPVDSMSVNRFLAEGSPLGAFGAASDPAGLEHEQVGRMLVDADRLIRRSKPPTFPGEPVERPSFGTQYVWDATGGARRYFQEDMIGPASTLAVGHGGMSHLHGGAYAIAGAPLREWIAATSRDEAPPVLAWDASLRFEQAFFVADRAARGQLDADEFERVFGAKLSQVFGAELAALSANALVRVTGDRLAATGASATELLCYLSDAELDAPKPPPVGDRVSIKATPEIADRLAELARDGAIDLDVSGGVSTADAQRLIDTVERLALDVRPVGSAEPVARQYQRIGELPPSVVWCRLAIRAIAALRALD